MLISLVVPCYNEEESLPIFYKEASKIAQQMGISHGADFEFIFVDDGSKDRTLQIARELHRKDARVRYISFSRNFGKEAGIYAGLKAAKGDYVATMDADLQDPPSLLPEMLELLLSGGYIVQTIEEDLTYDYLHSSEDNLWSILYLTGYLTRVREIPASDGALALTIPNAEVQEIFRSTIQKWFKDSSQTWNRQAMFQALWAGNSETLTKEIGKLLRKTISYHDYKEDFYHAFLAGILASFHYSVESNREHGKGRSDIVVYDEENSRVVIFEAKVAKSPEELPAACDAALRQIEARQYAEDFRDEYDEILCYGIAFYKKRCLVKMK